MKNSLNVVRAQNTSTSHTLSISCKNWAHHLSGLGGELKSLSSQTESDFLSIGAALQDFHVRGGEISKTASSVVDLMSGEEIVGAIDGLGQMLEQMNDYLTRLETETARGAKKLQQVLNTLEEVFESLAGFKKVIKQLSFLGIATKIESARLGQEASGFEALAGNVDQLATGIETKSANIRERLRALKVLARQTFSKVTGLQSKQRDQARIILDDVQLTLEKLSEKRRLSATTADNISIKSKELLQNIGEVVVAIQFQDITRQQMEQVQGTLDDLYKRLKLESNAAKDDSVTDPSILRELVEEVGYVSELEAAQIRHAGDELVTAVNNIVENLGGLVRHASGMANDTRELAGGIDKSHTLFLEEMEQGLSSVTSTLTDNVRTSAELFGAMQMMAGAAGDVSGFVSDVAEIGSEIELIALNAQIKAAHTGAKGAALGVLAEAIRRLSVDARQWTAAVADTLTNITSIAEEIEIRIDTKATHPEGGPQAEVTDMAQDLKILLNVIQQVNGQMASLFSGIEQAVQTLSADIEQTIAGISVHAAVQRKISPIVSTLDEIVGRSQLLVSATNASDKASRLKGLESKYVMRKQREIHRSVLVSENTKNLPVEAGVENTVNLDEEDEDDLGDNVELF